MKVVYVLAAVLLVLFLIGQIRVGAQVEYSGQGPCVWVKAGCFKIQVFPLKKKDKPDQKKTAKKTKKASKKREKKAAPKAEPAGQSGPETEPKPSVGDKVQGLVNKVGGALDYAQQLLPIVLQAVGSFYQKLQMDTLELELIVGAPDPADAAMRYGQASAALGALWYPLTQAFHVKDGNARVRLDFDSTEMTVYAMAVLTLKIGQIVWLALYFGIRALRAFLAVRKRQKKAKQQERKAA